MLFIYAFEEFSFDFDKAFGIYKDFVLFLTFILGYVDFLAISYWESGNYLFNCAISLGILIVAIKTL